MDQSLSKEVLDAAEAAKTEGHEVFHIKLAGKDFLYRQVYRKEWKTLLKSRNTAMIAAGDDDLLKVDVAEAEMENLLRVCLVYPKADFDRLPAGCIQTLCDLITEVSGFGGVEVESTKL